jgi:hypothetical protein
MDKANKLNQISGIDLTGGANSCLRIPSADTFFSVQMDDLDPLADFPHISSPNLKI